MRIHKLPIFAATFFALITLLAGLIKRESFDMIAWKVSIIIVIVYILGMLLKKALLVMAKEILQAKYLAEVNRMNEKKTHAIHEKEQVLNKP